MGHATSFATLRIDLIPRLTRPRQSRADSSEPSQIPGRISMGPSAYGTDGESSSRCRRWVVAAGSETTEGRLRGSGAGEGGTGHWSWIATLRELDEELVWRVSESRFTFRTDRGLVGERKDTDSDSDEGPDGDGVSPSVTTTAEKLAGGAILRLAGVFLLRGKGVVDCCVVDCMMIRREENGSDDLRAFQGEEERGYKTKKATTSTSNGCSRQIGPCLGTIRGRESGCSGYV